MVFQIRKIEELKHTQRGAEYNTARTKGERRFNSKYNRKNISF